MRGALACIGPSQEQTVFFETSDIAAGIDGPAIAQVTISEVRVSPDGNHWVGVAAVEKVIKGPIDSRTIHVLVFPTSCSRGLGSGAHGIIVGTLNRNRNGIIEVTARTDTLDARSRRRSTR